MSSILEDHRRFREIIKGRIKQHFKKYVTQGEMIGKQENEFVKIPVPSIEIPKFKYGPKDQGGVGQGRRAARLARNARALPGRGNPAARRQ